MEIKKIKNKKVWEYFLRSCEEKTFLHSWNWGEFKRTLGQEVWRFGIFENERLKAVALIVFVRAKRGNFLLVPHGPVSPLREKKSRGEIIKTLLEKLKKIGKNYRANFIRIAPVWERSEEGENVFFQNGFRDAPIHTHPELSWELNLNLSEEEILAGMRKNTRYLVRKALKNKELRVEKSDLESDLKVFSKLYRKTVKRHHFVPFSWNYLKGELSAFKENKEILILNSYFKNKPLSSALIVFWQDGGYYHQGASSHILPKIPSSYLVQWEAIKEAKKRGCRRYNFWGIVEEENHPWRGISIFKKGFGGRKVRYIKTKDYPLNILYYPTLVFEKIRKKKRGL